MMAAKTKQRRGAGKTSKRSRKKGTVGTAKKSQPPKEKGGTTIPNHMPKTHAKRMFPMLFARLAENGKGVYLATATRMKNNTLCRSASLEVFDPTVDGEHQDHPPVFTNDLSKWARRLHGLGHPDRIGLLVAMHSGARTHQELKRASRLQPGPIYHHLRELERSGLITCESRNQYQMTSTGLITLLVITGLDLLTSESRKRSQWITSRGELKKPACSTSKPKRTRQKPKRGSSRDRKTVNRKP